MKTTHDKCGILLNEKPGRPSLNKTVFPSKCAIPPSRAYEWLPEYKPLHDNPKLGLVSDVLNKKTFQTSPSELCCKESPHFVCAPPDSEYNRLPPLKHPAPVANSFNELTSSLDQ